MAIVRTRLISFTMDRVASLRKIRLGNESDNMVERLRFALPVIAEHQTATLVITGRADLVRLNYDDENGYYVDLTAEIVGADGETEAYVRIDGDAGEAWSSNPFRLITGELPDVDEEIEHRFPGAVETMLTEIERHRGEMQDMESRDDELSYQIRAFSPDFTVSGAAPTCKPLAGDPLTVLSHIDIRQEGSGNPSPSNVRPIVRHSQVSLTITDDEGQRVVTHELAAPVVRGSYNWATGEIRSNVQIRDVGAAKNVSTGTSSTGIKYVSTHNSGVVPTQLLACNRYRVTTSLPTESGYIRIVGGSIYIYDNAIDFDNPSAAYAGTEVVEPAAETVAQDTPTEVLAGRGINTLESSTGDTEVSGKGVLDVYSREEVDDALDLLAGAVQEVDETLTKSGAAADAAVVGEKISALSEEIEELHSIFREVEAKWISGVVKTSDATADLSPESIIANSSFAHLLVDYKVGDVYMLTGKGGQSGRTWAFVANDGTVLSKATPDKEVTDLVLTCDEDCTLVVQSLTNRNYSLRKKIAVGIDVLLGDVNARTEKVEQAIEKLETPAYVFGAGINCDYTTPTIPAFEHPGYGKNLAFFYDLYDGLVETYPDYVQKIDCDAEMAAAGIVKPDNLSDYPMYMYKFVPAFTPGGSDLVTKTISKPIKLFITTGTHGELMAVHDMYHAMQLVCEAWQTDANLEALRWECEIYIIPCSGLVTVDRGWRVNVNKVDLNRNCPTSKWEVKGEVGSTTYTGPEAGSEYETKVFMHYLAAIDPHVYVDHHNSSDESLCSYYAEAKEHSLINIAASVIAARSRKLRRNLEGVYPENDWTINGFVQTPKDQGCRCLYAYEQGYHSFTFETNPNTWYENGEAFPNGNNPYSSIAATVAVDGITNFILLALKELAKRPYIPAE